jgi:hypothetical protein
MSAKGIQGVHQHLERLASELGGVYGGSRGRTIRCCGVIGWIIRRVGWDDNISDSGGTRGCKLVAVRSKRIDECVNHAKHGWCSVRLGRGVGGGGIGGSLTQMGKNMKITGYEKHSQVLLSCNRSSSTAFRLPRLIGMEWAQGRPLVILSWLTRKVSLIHRQKK